MSERVMASNPSVNQDLVVRALRTIQGKGVEVYAFFIKGEDIVRVADISRIGRDDDDALQGFQRPEIRQHVKGILEYLDQGDVLFPNAIILAMSPDIRFSASRGSRPTGDARVSESGTLTLPVYEEGKRVAWIVDGQQRSLALSKARNREFAVPVIGFVSDSLSVQREQFILVNKAKPLPTRLINELLPDTEAFVLPRELAARKVPAELVNLLNKDPSSPFYKIIKRPSDKSSKGAVVTDSAVLTSIKRSLSNPLGALSPFKAIGREGRGDIEGMYRVLLTYWSAVKAVFPEAWGKDPGRSRLMHSAGLLAMGLLMDAVYARLSPHADIRSVQAEVERIAPICRWTEGVWEELGLAWNEIQSTPQHVKRLEAALVQAYSFNKFSKMNS
ncbi:DGQHR domain-containing protein DpdB [Halopseudomonas aestusnigri]|uniref:DGQHR domain-containing protein DpdB n=1 Tax=Halopseudomonas aestusnigri TaxID=857252 RepID=UPI0025570710|nr:DGQHR domain-containing protein DpdB [Halopseudomonas aestusnigri]MDL2198115.1 DGQHR domain-containing protein DpdB [Halopseudomonas aestusnigri]